MNIFNPTKMFFTKKNIQNSENEEEFIELSKEDILKTLNITPANTQVAKKNIIKVENILDMKEENSKNIILNKIDIIVNAVKSALNLEEPEEIQETNEEVVIEDAQDEASEETEVVEEQPSSEPEEGNEPPTDEQTVEVQNEEVVEEQEEQQQEQEEPQEEQEVEGECETPQEPKEVEETEEVQEVEEIEQSETEEVQDVIEAPTNIIAEEVGTQEVDEEVVDEKVNLLKEIENLKAEKEAKEIELKKMALSKEIESDFAGVPGKVEDKVDLVYEIKNSALADDTKKFIIDSLKSLSLQNLEDCQEIGHSQDIEVSEENEMNSKVKKAMSEHCLTEGQALLYIRGERTLAKAQEVSNKSRSKKR